MYSNQTSNNGSDPYISGQLLIAMPGMRDERFFKTVIYMCAHTEEGAMGLVLNQVMDSLSFPDLLEQLGIDEGNAGESVPIHFGGPVEAGRGFVLHSAEYQQDATLEVDDGVALTATVDILKAIARGYGPRQSLLALGYAGWGPGQLDDEIRANGWLQAPADHELIFGGDQETKWERSIAKIGIDPRMLSDEAGHA
jgi:putative transcriptional regulator|tara:strand:+ start:2182 stop:2769 length:588 start_codon:yes stop_codon:yes gene_type:complete